MRMAFVNLSLKFGSLLKPTKGLSLKIGSTVLAICYNIPVFVDQFLNVGVTWVIIGYHYWCLDRFFPCHC